MLVAFLIMLREGIEAALIVGIVAGFLKQSGHSKLMPKVRFGVVLASLMCLGLGYGIHSATGEIPLSSRSSSSALSVWLLSRC